MKLYICFVLLVLLIALSSSHRICWATGDPHYRTFGGYRVDLYGVEGDGLLSRSNDGKFQILSRMKYGKYWRNRALQIAVSVYMDGNIFNHYGSYWSLNGKKNSLARRKNNISIRFHSNRVWLHSRKTNIKVEFRFYGINNRGQTHWPKYYFNVYVGIPGSYFGKMSGMCGNGHYNRHADSVNWRNLATWHKRKRPRLVIMPKDNKNTFGMSYFPPPSKHIFHKIKWKSYEEKKKAYDYCYTKLKLTGARYKDCMFDIKVSGGDLDVAKGFAKMAKDLKKLENPSKLKKSDLYLKVYHVAKLIKSDLKLKKDVVKGHKTDKATGATLDFVDDLMVKVGKMAMKHQKKETKKKD